MNENAWRLQGKKTYKSKQQTHQSFNRKSFPSLSSLKGWGLGRSIKQFSNSFHLEPRFRSEKAFSCQDSRASEKLSMVNASRCLQVYRYGW